MDLEFREPDASEDLSEFFDLMASSYGIQDEAEVVPTHVFRAFIETHGMIAAYDDDLLVGFLCHWSNFEEPRRVYVHAMTVHPQYYNSGVGERLMLELERRSKELGYGTIYGTTDPLKGQVAQLYTGKCGNTPRKYVEGFYGAIDGGEPGQSVPEDRFIVEKDLHSEEPDYSPEDIEVVLVCSKSGDPEAGEDASLSKGADDSVRWEFSYGGDAELVGVEIPPDFDRMEHEERLEWRYASRAVFESLLKGNGGRYVGIDFLPLDTSDVEANTYVLSRV